MRNRTIFNLKKEIFQSKCFENIPFNKLFYNLKISYNIFLFSNKLPLLIFLLIIFTVTNHIKAKV